jgi:ribosome-binding protein aMBF1 (putative translation factor)
MATTRDYGKILERRIAADPDLAAAVAREDLNVLVAMSVYDARTSAGLTQAQLAKRIGTQQSVIARLENADYRGHSLVMLQKVAEATGRRLEVTMRPVESESGKVKRSRRSATSAT